MNEYETIRTETRIARKDCIDIHGIYVQWYRWLLDVIGWCFRHSCLSSFFGGRLRGRIVVEDSPPDTEFFGRVATLFYRRIRAYWAVSSRSPLEVKWASVGHGLNDMLDDMQGTACSAHGCRWRQHGQKEKRLAIFPVNFQLLWHAESWSIVAVSSAAIGSFHNGKMESDLVFVARCFSS